MTVTRRSVLTAAVAATALGAGAVVAGQGAPPAAAAGLPGCRPRYQGYQGGDYATPWASYFAGATLPPQEQVELAATGPAVPAVRIPAFRQLAGDLNGPGYSEVETGYGVRANGVAWVACLTRMPGVTAQMWDWWFGWHLSATSRYKLWHPDAHLHASVQPDAAADAAEGRARYLGRTSFVDEYIGDQLTQLAIQFVDPRERGLDLPDGSTVVYATVGSAILPVRLGYVAHQVRPVAGGSEMRSRFYLNKAGLRDVVAAEAACAVSRGFVETLVTPLPFGADFARDLMVHCGQEMNHLASFLPRLYEEFRGTR